MAESASKNIVTIVGTARPGNYTAKAMALVNDELRRREVAFTAVLASELTLGFPGQPPTEDAKTLEALVAGATGLVLGTPEYHGTFASMMKLVIENLGFPSKMSGKPVALLGVAAGQIGAIKSLEQLRGVCSHVGALVLPGPVSVAGVQGLFDEDGNCTDERVEKRIRGVATTLVDYIDRRICPAIALERMAREAG